MTDVPDPQPPAPEENVATQIDRERTRLYERVCELEDSLREAERELEKEKQAWWDQRNDWVRATGYNQDLIDKLESRAEAAEARVRELEEALRECRKLFVELRSDWSDNRGPCREGFQTIDRALLGSGEGQEPGA